MQNKKHLDFIQCFYSFYICGIIKFRWKGLVKMITLEETKEYLLDLVDTSLNKTLRETNGLYNIEEANGVLNLTIAIEKRNRKISKVKFRISRSKTKIC